MEKSKHVINNLELATAWLKKNNEQLCGEKIQRANMAVLSKPNFYVWPASLEKHQAYEGGLAVHTAQIANTALHMLNSVENVRQDLVFTACVWHDSAKLLDYVKKDGKWVRTEFRDIERHLVRSYADWREAAKYEKICEEDMDFVCHLMLAHHGRKEWGSPVEPQCAEAWAIHAADNLSARFLL